MLQRIDPLIHVLNLSNNQILLEIGENPPDKYVVTKCKMI
jgi:hypothetical protein